MRCSVSVVETVQSLRVTLLQLAVFVVYSCASVIPQVPSGLRISQYRSIDRFKIVKLCNKLVVESNVMM